MHTQISDEIVVCPNCQNQLGALAVLKGRRVRCKACRYEYNVEEPVREEHPPQEENEVSPQAPNHGFLFELLDYIEDKIVRMIGGIFRFALLRVPKQIYRFIIEFSPTMSKLVKVSILLGIYLLILLGPLLLSLLGLETLKQVSVWQGQHSESFISRHLDTERWQLFLTLHQRSIEIIANCWTVIASLGSLYGLWCLKKKHKARVPQATEPG